jgi:hypothetical protein
MGTLVDGDMLARLGQLQAKVARIGEVAGRLAAAVPTRAEGCDASGSVEIVLAGDGIPDTITVRNGWDRRLEADGLAAAVMDANTEAIRSGMTAWGNQLDDTRWWAQRADLDENDPQPPANSPSLPEGIARDPNALAEDVLKALHNVQRPPAAPARGEGSDSGRHVVVVLEGAGLADCSVQSDWAARRDGDTITAALNQALRAAKRAMPGRPAPATGLDALLGDALATLRSVTQQPSAGGETR